MSHQHLKLNLHKAELVISSAQAPPPSPHNHPELATPELFLAQHILFYPPSVSYRKLAVIVDAFHHQKLF